MEGMEKQTAVEWLIEEIEKLTGLQYLDEEDCVIKAKEMEKDEQRKLGIILAIFAEEIGDKKFTDLLIKAEQYYNETYKSE
jgi:hypothetical protein